MGRDHAGGDATGHGRAGDSAREYVPTAGGDVGRFRATRATEGRIFTLGSVVGSVRAAKRPAAPVPRPDVKIPHSTAPVPRPKATLSIPAVSGESGATATTDGSISMLSKATRNGKCSINRFGVNIEQMINVQVTITLLLVVEDHSK